ncbi:hypothetical protein AtDm6_1080 [Acetobacter tropicalis]|uniref:Uncharacterized protein n=1 Tax=Acetobacter tropicalis TaxID=104102 RepID=A0A094YR55_9PROT|nr:hypothetical protein AtDm6_1080 [Acetobacter tropicalis]
MHCGRIIRLRRFALLASRARDANVARLLLSLAAVREGVSRGDAARHMTFFFNL